MANVMPANQRSARRTGIPLRVVSIGAAVSAHRPAPSLVPYGAWSSPLSAEAQSAGRVGIADLRSVDGRLYWTQTEPAAGGISALYTFRGGAPYNSRGDAAAALSPASCWRSFPGIIQTCPGMPPSSRWQD
jgi:hypothetical protein